MALAINVAITAALTALVAMRAAGSSSRTSVQAVMKVRNDDVTVSTVKDAASVISRIMPVRIQTASGKNHDTRVGAHQQDLVRRTVDEGQRNREAALQPDPVCCGGNIGQQLVLTFNPADAAPNPFNARPVEAPWP